MTPRWLTLLYSVIILAPAAFAEEPANQLVFRAGVRLVQVDVLVHDKNGHPVVGLSKDDFILIDNGKPRSIDFFSIRSLADPAQKPLPLPHGAISNRLDDRDHEPIPATVILFDCLNTAVEDQAFARFQAMKYLESVSDTEQIAVYTLGKTLNVVQEFTNDRAQLLNALKRYRPESSVDLAAADLVSNLLPTGNASADAMTRNAAAGMLDNARRRRADITTAAFEVIARHLSGLPGRKNLIWISASLPLIVSEQRERLGRQWIERQDFVSDFDRPARLLNTANVSLYPIDPRGPLVGLLDPNLDLMIRIADKTGGKAAYVTNGLSEAIHQALLDSEFTYTLGFYPSDRDFDGMFHNLSVKVARSGVEVRHRMGYLAFRRQAMSAEQRRGRLNAWVQDPLEATDVRISAVANPIPKSQGFYRVEVTIDPSALQLEHKNGRWTGSLDLAIVPDMPAKPKGLHQTISINLSDDRLRASMTGGLVISNTVQVTDGSGKLLAPKLHIVVQDGASFAAGSVRLPLAPQE